MAITEVYGRQVCRCEKCGHVWLALKIGKRCGNPAKRCWGWNEGGVKQEVEAPKNFGKSRNVTGMCVHGREAKFCVYCQKTAKGK